MTQRSKRDVAEIVVPGQIGEPHLLRLQRAAEGVENRQLQQPFPGVRRLFVDCGLEAIDFRLVLQQFLLGVRFGRVEFGELVLQIDAVCLVGLVLERERIVDVVPNAGDLLLDIVEVLGGFPFVDADGEHAHVDVEIGLRKL